MTIYRMSSLKLSLIFGCLAMPLTTFAYEPVHDSPPVQIVNSKIAIPRGIHVQKTEEGIEVKGWVIKRKKHSRRKLRGHVDVEIVSNEGDIVAKQTTRIKRKIGSSRHDHQRRFSVLMSAPIIDGYSVRVTHHNSRSDL